MVRSVRWPIHVERPEQSLGDTGPSGPERERRFGLTHRRVRAIISCMHPKSLARLEIDLVDTIFEGLQEQSRLKITSELRKFIEVETTTRR